MSIIERDFKACPHCGSKMIMVTDKAVFDQWQEEEGKAAMVVTCHKCKATISDYGDQSYEEMRAKLKAKWNSRTNVNSFIADNVVPYLGMMMEQSLVHKQTWAKKLITVSKVLGGIANAEEMDEADRLKELVHKLYAERRVTNFIQYTEALKREREEADKMLADFTEWRKTYHSPIRERRGPVVTTPSTSENWYWASHERIGVQRTDINGDLYWAEVDITR